MLDLERLPDSENLQGLCPRCGLMCGFSPISNMGIKFDYESRIGNDYDELERVAVLLCQNCHQCTVVIGRRYVDSPDGKFNGPIRYAGIHWWPLPQMEPNPDIPGEIGACLQETVQSYAAGCFRSAVVMARRTIEAVANDKGATKSRLVDQIQELEQQGIISSDIYDWATEVRLVGNQGAHFDPINAVDRADAMEVLLFTRKLLEYVYEMPAQLMRMRSRKTK